jgi:4-diphosphocytidyl-2-C-methyl-D-erythritol kinase
MKVTVRSFAKINIGLYIGGRRADGFHDLRTVYQTIALHDRIKVSAERGSGIEIICDHPAVPCDHSNTCFRIAERVKRELGSEAKISIEIEKRLPVQGGLGAASSNAISVMLAVERVLRKKLTPDQRMRIAADVGSDVPLFLVGGAVLGVGRGEEVYPLPDLPGVPVVVVTPEIGVSTPQAFADWDAQFGSKQAQLTLPEGSDKLLAVGRALSAWLSGLPNSGAPAKGGSRAGSLLLDLVRTGIENDFEKVVFPKYPELRDIKLALQRAGAGYASLSGSGSTLYGLFRSSAEATQAVKRLRKHGLRATATTTLARSAYWKKIVDC